MTYVCKLVDSLLNTLRKKDEKTFQGRFPPANNFRTMKDLIDKSSVLFPILRSMPKGGILHIHSVGDAKSIVQYGTYLNECYINVGNDTTGIPRGSFQFATTQPPNINGTIWQQVNLLRKNAANQTAFDEQLFQSTQFYTPDPDVVSEDDMWSDFDDRISRLDSLWGYLPVFNATFFPSLQKLVDDNVQYVELRGVGTFHDLSRTYSQVESLKIVLEKLQEFSNKSSKPFALKFIYVSDRRDDTTEIFSLLKDAVQLIQMFPDDVLGYDLVDEEDRFFPLIYYIDDFIAIQNYTATKGYAPLRFFFHAGETTRYRAASSNLYDAILLNTTRIGHGYALKDYPVLMDLVKQRGIALEVCPISNQMLRLLNNVQNHPALTFINFGLPVTISPDDPLVYGYNGVSYDFYYAYFSWNLTLSDLKQLANNSLSYSGLTNQEKIDQLNLWKNSWDAWIKNIVYRYWL